jgi:hypothetical protein
MPPYRKIRAQVRRRAARIARSWSQDPGGSNDGVGQSAPSLRLERLPLSPSQALQALLPGYRKLEQWPYSGDRLGPSYFARVYGLGPSGLDYADAWLRENRAEHYEAQELRHWLFPLDQLLCDGVDIVNSVGCEGIARRCRAIEWTYKMGGPCSPGALEFFAAKLCSTSSDVRVPAADRAVRRQLAFNASFAKLARRAARVSDASTAWW